jgi:hypothetical protein
MNMRLYITLGLAAVLLMLSVTVLAHHSAVNFWYTDRKVEIEGTVVSVKIVNPHPEMVIEVTEANGQKSQWRISGGGHATGMIRAGWRDETLPVGTKVKVKGSPSRQEGAKALLAGDVTRPDGKVISFSSGASPIDE